MAQRDDPAVSQTYRPPVKAIQKRVCATLRDKRDQGAVRSGQGLGQIYYWELVPADR